MIKIRIVIIEDNDEFRDAYTEILNQHQQLTVARLYPAAKWRLRK